MKIKPTTPTPPCERGYYTLVANTFFPDKERILQAPKILPLDKGRCKGCPEKCGKGLKVFKNK